MHWVGFRSFWNWLQNNVGLLRYFPIFFVGRECARQLGKLWLSLPWWRVWGGPYCGLHHIQHVLAFITACIPGTFLHDGRCIHPSGVHLSNKPPIASPRWPLTKTRPFGSVALSRRCVVLKPRSLFFFLLTYRPDFINYLVIRTSFQISLQCCLAFWAFYVARRGFWKASIGYCGNCCQRMGEAREQLW